MKKVCSRCKVKKQTTEFHKNCKGANGLTAKCKTCVSSYMKKYYKENRESDLERSKLWRESKKANHLYKAKCSTGHYYIGSTTESIEIRSGKHFRQYGSSKSSLLRHCEKYSLNREDLEWAIIKEFESPEEMRLAEKKILQELSGDPLLLNYQTVFGEESRKKAYAREKERMKDPKNLAKRKAQRRKRYHQRKQEDPEYRERLNAYNRERKQKKENS